MSLNLNPKEFLFLYGSVVAAIVLFLVWKRPGSKKGFRLSSTRWFAAQRPSTMLKGKRDLELATERRPTPSRTLNVFFNYNGHSWDAYEVLGLSAGSSLEKAEEAFEEAVKDLDEGSKVFLKTALEAIRSSQS